MKHIKLFETYISEKYITYDKLGKWGKYSNESEVEDDLRMVLIKLFQFGAISDHLDDLIYTDQSSDKGIKWQIEVTGKGSDIIHAYKDGKFKGQYEWYLNKKKSSEYDIQQYFLNKYLSDLEKYSALLDSYEPSKRNHRHFKSLDEWKAQSKELADAYSELSTSDKKKAQKEFDKRFKEFAVSFPDFKGY